MKSNKKIGIRDIAKKAGVSIGTVDRVLHNRPEVSAKTREKILKIIKELNYRPNVLAQRLASDKIYRFSILIPKPSVDNSYWKAPLSGILKAETEIQAYGIQLDNYFFNLNDKDSFRRESLKLITSKPDGVIVAPVFEHESKEFLRKCDDNKIPYVLLDTIIKNQSYLSYYGQNSQQSGYLAGKLISFKLKKHSGVLIINFASELNNRPHLQGREEGLRNYLKEQNFKGRVQSINISSRAEKDIDNLILDNIRNSTRGIFATSSAHKVAKIVKTAGKRKRIMVGYDLTEDNILYLENRTIDFLICQRPFEQGYHSLMSLFDHFVQKTKLKKNNLMPLEIITRENYKNSLDYKKYKNEEFNF